MAKKLTTKTMNLSPQEQVIRHRNNERERHRMMTAALKTMREAIPGSFERESQVQSLKRISNYGCYLKSLLNRGTTRFFEEGELQDMYLRGKNYVDAKNAQPFFQPPTRSRRSILSSQGSSITDYDMDGEDKYLIVVETNAQETQAALAHLDRIMRQERRAKETENVDTNNCNFDDSPPAKQRRVVVIRQPQLPMEAAFAAMRY